MLHLVAASSEADVEMALTLLLEARRSSHSSSDDKWNRGHLPGIAHRLYPVEMLIDIFLQPSASTKPLQVISVLKRNKSVVVDVSKGAQQNPPLNELLSYLNTDSAGKL